MVIGDDASPVYLDHAATTPVRPEVVDVMVEVMRGVTGNPSGAHGPARRARDVVEESRERIAEVLGATPGEIVLCSGGTEADDLAVTGAVRRRGGTAVCTSVEHPAVLEAVEALGGVVAPVDGAGLVDLDRLADAVDASTSLVSVMAVNNEVGVVQPVAEVAALVRELAPGAVVHTDAVQAAPWLDLRELVQLVDLVSVSAHKLGGPQGVGCLVVRDGVLLEPRQRGGGQERDRRSGTHHVAGIAGMAVAMNSAAVARATDGARVTALRDRLLDGLLAAVPDLVVPGEAARRRGTLAPHVATVAVPGSASEELLYLLDRAGIAASAGSACSSGAQQVPHTLAAMGLDPAVAGGAVRFSLGHTSCDADVDRVLDAMPAIAAHLRGAPVAVR